MRRSCGAPNPSATLSAAARLLSRDRLHLSLTQLSRYLSSTLVRYLRKSGYRGRRKRGSAASWIRHLVLKTCGRDRQRSHGCHQLVLRIALAGCRYAARKYRAAMPDRNHYCSRPAKSSIQEVFPIAGLRPGSDRDFRSTFLAWA